MIVTKGNNWKVEFVCDESPEVLGWGGDGHCKPVLLSWCEQMVTEAKDKRQEVPHFNASVS